MSLLLPSSKGLVGPKQQNEPFFNFLFLATLISLKFEVFSLQIYNMRLMHCLDCFLSV